MKFEDVRLSISTELATLKNEGAECANVFKNVANIIAIVAGTGATEVA